MINQESRKAGPASEAGSLFSNRQRLIRELRGDLRHLRSKAIRLIDKLTITQGDIMLIRGRLQRLTK